MLAFFLRQQLLDQQAHANADDVGMLPAESGERFDESATVMAMLGQRALIAVLRQVGGLFHVRTGHGGDALKETGHERPRVGQRACPSYRMPHRPATGRRATGE
jgi:hypothetical protein